MSPASRTPPTALQLTLSASPAERASAISTWQNARTLEEELRDFAAKLAQEGYGAGTVRTYVADLRGLVDAVGCGTVGDLLTQPTAVVEALQHPARALRRQAFHLVLSHYRRLCAARHPAAVLRAFEETLDARLRGRTVPQAHLVDRNLGGDRKAARPRVLLSWDDAVALAESARLGAPSGRAARDEAFITVSCWSGLRPELVRTLRWETVTCVLGSSDSIERVVVPTPLGARSVAFETTAVAALRRLWRSRGEPRTGHVFTASPVSAPALSKGHVQVIVARAACRAGLPPISRPRLRGVLGWRLKQQGWADLALRDALGFERVSGLRNLLRPYDESAALARASEHVVVPRATESEVTSSRTSILRRSRERSHVGMPENPGCVRAPEQSRLPIKDGDAVAQPGRVPTVGGGAGAPVVRGSASDTRPRGV